eukprot:6021740-Alexandrium_andersonii.AAC.1
MSGPHTPVGKRSGEFPAEPGGGAPTAELNGGDLQGTHAGVLPARRARVNDGSEQRPAVKQQGTGDGSGSRRPLAPKDYRWAEKVLGARAASAGCTGWTRTDGKHTPEEWA